MQHTTSRSIIGARLIGHELVDVAALEARIAGFEAQADLAASADFPAGEWHWHGAAPDRFVTHLAILEAAADGPETAWGELVTDAEYLGTGRGADPMTGWTGDEIARVPGSAAGALHRATRRR
jgi:hypothetical protein